MKAKNIFIWEDRLHSSTLPLHSISIKSSSKKDSPTEQMHNATVANTMRELVFLVFTSKCLDYAAAHLLHQVCASVRRHADF